MSALKIIPSTSAAISDEIETPPAPRKPRRGEFRIVKRAKYNNLFFVEVRRRFWWSEVGYGISIEQARSIIADKKRAALPVSGVTVIEDGL